MFGGTEETSDRERECQSFVRNISCLQFLFKPLKATQSVEFKRKPHKGSIIWEETKTLFISQVLLVQSKAEAVFKIGKKYSVVP